MGLGHLILWAMILPASPEVGVLQDPQSALEHIGSVREAAPLRAAEIQLLAQDPRGCLKTVQAKVQSPKLEERPVRWLRLEADCLAALGEPLTAKLRLDALEKRPGWRKHAQQTRARLQQRVSQVRWARGGLILFAFAMALLLLSGARELLRPSAEFFVFAGAAALACVLVFWVSPPLGVLSGILGVATMGLVHGASAGIRRTAAGPRARVLMVTLVLLGVLGVGLGIVAQLGVPTIVALF